MLIEEKLVPQRAGTWGHLSIIKHQIITLHDPGNDQSIDQVDLWIRSGRSSGAYNEIISGEAVRILIPENYRAVHGAFFGGVEWNKEFWPEIAARGMQNRYSYGICIIRPLQGQTWNTLVQRLATHCFKWNLDPFKHVVCHYHIDPGKTDPIHFYNNPPELDRLRLQVAKEMGINECVS